MGYYSDVMVSTNKEGFEFLKKRCEGYNLFDGYGYVVEYNDGENVVFGWKGVKWYPSFDEVAAFMKALEEIDEERIPYEYLEVGEDGDTEYLYSSYESPNKQLCVSHSIEVL